jgi:hypothetical protein
MSENDYEYPFECTYCPSIIEGPDDLYSFGEAECCGKCFSDYSTA